MAPYYEIEKPPVLRGTPEQRDEQLRRYLQRLVASIERAVNANNEKGDEKNGNDLDGR